MLLFTGEGGQFFCIRKHWNSHTMMVSKYYFVDDYFPILYTYISCTYSEALQLNFINGQLSQLKVVSCEKAPVRRNSFGSRTANMRWGTGRE